jgi:hypothetical protein
MTKPHPSEKTRRVSKSPTRQQSLSPESLAPTLTRIQKQLEAILTGNKRLDKRLGSMEKDHELGEKHALNILIQLEVIHHDLERLLPLLHREIAPIIRDFLQEAAQRGFTPEQWVWVNEMLEIIIGDQNPTAAEDRKDALSQIQTEIGKSEKSSTLHIHSNLDISAWDTLQKFPTPIVVHGYLDISFCTSLKQLGEITVEGDIIMEGCSDGIIEEAYHLKEAGKIKGEVVLKQPIESK